VLWVGSVPRFLLCGKLKQKVAGDGHLPVDQPDEKARREFEKAFGPQIALFAESLKDHPDVRNAIVKDFGLAGGQADGELAFQIAWRINANFESWLYGALMKAAGANRDVMLKLAARSVFLAMSPTYAERVHQLKEQADADRNSGKENREPYSIPIPHAAEGAVAEMIKTWALKKPGGDFAQGRDGKRITFESGPEMPHATLKRALYNEFNIPEAASDADNRLAGHLKARLLGFQPIYLVLDELGDLIKKIRDDPALGCLFLLIKAKSERLRGKTEKDDVEFVSYLEQTLKMFFNDSDGFK
jgi:hypothetical protein